MTDIVTLDNAHLHSEDIDEKADAEVQVAANDNAFTRINTAKGSFLLLFAKTLKHYY